MTEQEFISVHDREDNVVLRVTDKGIYVRPGMDVDEAAQIVIERFAGYFAQGWAKARQQAFEEAARVADGMWWQGRENLTSASYAAAKEVGDEIAAAIRALSPPPAERSE